jgi:GAF domain-containing protein
MIGTDETVRPWSVETGEELRALYEFTEAIYHARSVDEVYASALEVISKTLGCERASILLFDAAGVMQFVAWNGIAPDCPDIPPGSPATRIPRRSSSKTSPKPMNPTGSSRKSRPKASSASASCRSRSKAG